MPVYLIIDITIIDQDVYGEFVARVPAVVEQYGGRYLARGGEVSTMVGDWRPERIVLIEFETIEPGAGIFCLAGVPGPGPPPGAIRHLPGHYRRGL